MFQGSLPEGFRSLLHEVIQTWEPGGDLYVGCSGNYTIERLTQPLGFKLHSNDVNPYSCAVGWWFSEGKVPFTLKEESRNHLGWTRTWMRGPARWRR